MIYEYKSTHLPWLSQIPHHWELARNKVVLTESKETVGANHADYQLLSLTKGGVIIRDLSTGKGKFPSDFGTYKIVSEGQIIFCLFDIDETPRTVGLSKHNGMITGAYDVFTISGANPRYIEYYYLSLDDVKAMRPLYTGLRKVIGINTFMQTHIPLPPREEQDQIVLYLDWKVSEINKLINAKRQQITLLQEKRQQTIFEAVKAKSDWSRDKITRLFVTIGSGTTPKSGNFDYYANGNTPWVNSGDLKGKNLYTAQRSVNDNALSDYSVLKQFNEDTIIIAMYGASIGNLSIAKMIFCSNQACCNLSEIDDRLHLDFAYYSLFMQRLAWIEESKGGGQPNISQDVIKQTWLHFPSYDEQVRISTFLNARCLKIDNIIKMCNDEIALLNEYRTRLISDAVTGKKDVRGVVVPQYEAVEVISEINETEAEEHDENNQ